VQSFNGKLRDELLAREVFDTLREAKVLIERWRRAYNTVRPHSSLGYRPPAPESRRPCPLASATPPRADRGDPLAGLPLREKLIRFMEGRSVCHSFSRPVTVRFRR
jgi:transposase InsO family protein